MTLHEEMQILNLMIKGFSCWYIQNKLFTNFGCGEKICPVYKECKFDDNANYHTGHHAKPMAKKILNRIKIKEILKNE